MTATTSLGQHHARFGRIGAIAVSRRRLILFISLGVVVVAAFFGVKAPSVLGGGGFVSPNAPSQLAANALTSEFHGGGPNLIFVVTARSGTVNSIPVASAGLALTRDLVVAPGVTTALSYWTTLSPALMSRNSTQGLVEARVSPQKAANRLIAEFSVAKSEPGLITVLASGTDGVNQAINTQIGKDLALAEGV
ncbi:MAG: MMPL family transporter, partial [Acidimicrobiales bacterium]